MYVATLMFREWFNANPTLYLFAVFSAIVWLMWAIKTIVSWSYRPATAPFSIGTSVLIPVVDEPEELFRDVLNRICAQRPDEVIVVINGPRNENLERICADYPLVRVLWTTVPGKRNALQEANRVRTQPIAVLVDSDTIWTTDGDGTLAELVKPFRDPRVGGVTTRQRILEHDRKFITRWADWLESTRCLYSFPMQSVVGQIGCLPGRTIAFRGDILDQVMPDFMGQKFLGTFLEVSDDRTLTNLTLKAGYRTVYQHTSLVYTDAPTNLRKLYKQQLRWARGSQYNTLRCLPWYLGHAPLLGFFFAMDIVLPFLLIGGLISWAYRSATGAGVNFYQPILDANPGWHGYAIVAGLAVVASWTSMLIRQYRHWRTRPGDLARMPLFILFSSFFLMPIRLIGFFKLAHNAAWGTRAHAFSGEGDEAAHAGVDAIDVTRRPAVVDLREPVPVADGTTLLKTATVPAQRVVEHAPLNRSIATEARLPRLSIPTRTRRFNPHAAIPYLIGTAVLVTEVWLSVR